MKLRDKNSILEAMRADRVKSITVDPKIISNKRVAGIIDEARERNVIIHKVTSAGSRSRRGKGGIAEDLVALCEPFKYAPIEDFRAVIEEKGDKALIVGIDHVQDPRNLGAILRTAAATGVDGVVIERKRCCEVTETVYETSCGGAERVPIARVPNLRQTLTLLKKWGCWIVGTDERAEKSCYEMDLNMAVALVIGSEGEGMARIVKRESDFMVRIPTQPRFPSLNVSVAAAVLMFETARQQGRF